MGPGFVVLERCDHSSQIQFRGRSTNVALTIQNFAPVVRSFGVWSFQFISFCFITQTFISNKLTFSTRCKQGFNFSNMEIDGDFCSAPAHLFLFPALWLFVCVGLCQISSYVFLTAEC